MTPHPAVDRSYAPRIEARYVCQADHDDHRTRQRTRHDVDEVIDRFLARTLSQHPSWAGAPELEPTPELLARYAEYLTARAAVYDEHIGEASADVSAVEHGVRAPSPTFAQACDAATGAPKTFARWQVQVVQESYPAFFAPVVEFERSAARIHSWDLGAVPGLLQTEAYARAVIRAGRPAASDAAVERTVEARIGRQDIPVG